MIRPFQIGDLFLVQRLGRQATSLNVIQALLQPRSALYVALAASAPWMGASTSTFVLRQQDNGLARAGFLQSQRRPNRPEADIVTLAPGLDSAWGHPAIWKKLLSYYVQEAAHQKIARIYADVPDQPLPVNTFSEVGFRTYTRQTIWRLTGDLSHHALPRDDRLPASAMIRPHLAKDEWNLLRLYTQITPKPVQHAEGTESLNWPQERGIKPFFLDWWYPGSSNNYVLIEQDRLAGCILIGQSQHGYWMRLMANTQQPKTEHIHYLLHYGLAMIGRHRPNLPVYIGVRDYHGGLNSILADYGFAPFSDRARMVKHLVVLARDPVILQQPLLEAVAEVVPTAFAIPEIIKPEMTAMRERTWAATEEAS